MAFTATRLLCRHVVDRKWHLFDAQDKVMGRLASSVVPLLMGKHKPNYTPENVDVGDFVVIVNCDKVHISGEKRKQKLYRWHTGYVGGLKQRTFEEMITRKPTEPMRKAVWGMLPDNRLHTVRMERLKLYPGPLHPHTQLPQLPHILESATDNADLEEEPVGGELVADEFGVPKLVPIRRD